MQQISQNITSLIVTLASVLSITNSKGEWNLHKSGLKNCLLMYPTYNC